MSHTFRYTTTCTTMLAEHDEGGAFQQVLEAQRKAAQAKEAARQAWLRRHERWAQQFRAKMEGK